LKETRHVKTPQTKITAAGRPVKLDYPWSDDFAASASNLKKNQTSAIGFFRFEAEAGASVGQI